MVVLRYVVVFAAAVVGGMVAALPASSAGLVAPGFAVWPLALGVGAAFAALCAVCVGNLLVWGASRGRLLWILFICEATAGVLAVIVLEIGVTEVGRDLLSPLSNFEIVLVAIIAIAVNACVATWHWREQERSYGRDAVLTLGIVAGALLAPPALLLLACPLIGCSG